MNGFDLGKSKFGKLLILRRSVNQPNVRIDLQIAKIKRSVVGWDVRALGGLPEAGNPFYPAILALWIFFFGVLYLLLLFSKTKEKFFVLVSALGKSSFAVLLAFLAFTNRLSARAAQMIMKQFETGLRRDFTGDRQFADCRRAVDKYQFHLENSSKSGSIKPLRAASENKSSRL